MLFWSKHEFIKELLKMQDLSGRILMSPMLTTCSLYVTVPVVQLSVCNEIFVQVSRYKGM